MRSVVLGLLLPSLIAIVACAQTLPPERIPEIANGNCALMQSALQIDDLDEASSMASILVTWLSERYRQIRVPPSAPHPPLPALGSDIHPAAAATCAEIRADLLAGDPSNAYAAAVRLRAVLEHLVADLPASPQAKFARMEKAVSQLSGLPRFYRLVKLAQAAFCADDYGKATAYANELLSAAPQYPDNWNHGNAIYFGNWMLGRVVLHGPRNRFRRDWGHFLDWELDRPSPPQRAGMYLLKAAASPGSPQLNTFGPNMTLAKELLEQGEREVVLRYFELCAKFWRMENGKLAEWTAVVKRGDMPNFGANLRY